MDFSDITGHWAEVSIEKLSALECISRYEYNRFRPEQFKPPVTFEQEALS